MATSPALQKVFDEVLVNAVDNHARFPGQCTRIAVTVHTSPPRIAVSNDGPTLPLGAHPSEKLPVPQLLFGELLTGSNFDDGDRRLTGGRHGYGAKLANIFSDEFEVQCVSPPEAYTQRWGGNMSRVEAPVRELLEDSPDLLSPFPPPASSTTVSFSPSLRLLSPPSDPSELPAGDRDAMLRRAADVAACNPALSVTFNGQPLKLSSFSSYARLFLPPPPAASPPNHLSLTAGRWEVVVAAASPPLPLNPSFVNSLSTPRGGAHLSHALSLLSAALLPLARRRSRSLSDLTPRQVRDALTVFVSCRLESPDFDTQSKEFLTSPPEEWGSAWELPHDFKERLAGTSVLGDLVGKLSARRSESLGSGIKRGKGNKLSIAKLDDANRAGPGTGGGCTLVLTEGDSAKALAVSGLSVLGRDEFGVFPLRGKVLNVRDVSAKALGKNKEVENIVRILGLDFKKRYKDEKEVRSLRYGGVMVMADQDNDGSHIKGLLLNFFRVFWPELLRRKPEFVSQFVTPIMKARRGKEVEVFYSQQEYDRWAEELGEKEVGKWKVKYYKGLGTSTAAEGKEYFHNLEHHRKMFTFHDESDEEAIDMAFDKNRSEDRRKWILDNYDPHRVADFGERVRLRDFVDEELVNFSNADNIRSIPSVVDGLKPSQRKVLFGCFKKKLKSEMKVAQLAGYIAEQTSYHHGEQSLYTTIVSMAQNFVGSNNLPLLSPNGQFGTRLAGGKDSASPRYIFTNLTEHARKVFPESDDPLLAAQFDDGLPIEPANYVPVIPTLLVNGVAGIGTGWSTSVPQYSPRDLIDVVRARIEGREPQPLVPYYEGFRGDIIPDTEGEGSGFFTRGIITKTSKFEVEITELPVGKWTTAYKDTLMDLREKGVIKDFTEHHSTENVHFKLYGKQKAISDLSDPVKGYKALKLESRISTNNMNAFNADGVIVKYDSPEAIVDGWFPVRLALYADRKKDMLLKLGHTVRVLGNRARFIEAVVGGDLELFNGKKTRLQVVEELERMGFDTRAALDGLLEGAAGAEEAGGAEEGAGRLKSFDYLLSTPVSSFTRDKIEALEREKETEEAAFAELQETSEQLMWLRDLDALEDALPNN